MKRDLQYFLITIVLVFSMILTACGSTASGPIIDYADAESFEAALNAGENLEGKIVSFKALELHPDSALGYNVWAGEHLNFVSERNPDIKEDETVTVKTDTIKNTLGSWVITYEKVENAVVGDTTISSETDNDSTEADSGEVHGNSNSAEVGNNSADLSALESSTVTKEEIEEKEDPTIEYINSDIVAFNSYGTPYASGYVAVKNTSDYPIQFKDMRFNYEDNDKKLLAVDDMVNCVPEVLKPGQTGYIYSYYFSLEGLNLSNGLVFEPDGDVVAAENFYEIDVSDINVNNSGSGILSVKIAARGTNNTDKDISFAKPGAIYFDKDDKIVGFCYGYEDFDAGQTKSFEISGDLMSKDYDPSIVKRVELYIQGNSWF